MAIRNVQDAKLDAATANVYADSSVINEPLQSPGSSMVATSMADNLPEERLPRVATDSSAEDDSVASRHFQAMHCERIECTDASVLADEGRCKHAKDIQREGITRHEASLNERHRGKKREGRLADGRRVWSLTDLSPDCDT